jgi:hypothetical protein
MIKEEEPKIVVVLKVPDKKARTSAGHEQEWRDWLQYEREQAFKRNPRLLH